jgi:hypothetical protein
VLYIKSAFDAAASGTIVRFSLLYPLAGILSPMPYLQCLVRLRLPAVLGAIALASTLVLPPRYSLAQAVAPSEYRLENRGLVASGVLRADARDKFGETTISASGLAMDRKAWRRTADHYRGVIHLLPDRGYNISGTIDFQPRIHRLSITLNSALAPKPGQMRRNRVVAKLVDTIKLKDAVGVPLTGLDPLENEMRPAANGFPNLPQASNGRISLDPEALVLLPNGEFFIGDEYGPYIYRFSAKGRMLAAIRPPAAFIPLRNGKESFSSNNPGAGADAPRPADPEFGRQNNQGLEGLTLTPDGKTLVAILQSATRQDGGNSAATRQHTRILFYDISIAKRPKLMRQHVVVLPGYSDAEGKKKIAAQSELLALDGEHFLLLCRDTQSGYGLANAASVYRRIELLDTSHASNIAGSKYDGSMSLAPNGKLEPEIAPATLTPFIDINDNEQLAKFGLHNGLPNDRSNLSEKWEAMGLVPVLDPAHPRDFFLFVANDNDFITQKGFQAGAAYKDPSGVDVDTRFLVYRISIPNIKAAR